VLAWAMGESGSASELREATCMSMATSAKTNISSQLGYDLIKQIHI
jgi:hypothetical protein